MRQAIGTLPARRGGRPIEAALSRKRIGDAAAELEGIMVEFYDVLAQHKLFVTNSALPYLRESALPADLLQQSSIILKRMLGRRPSIAFYYSLIIVLDN